MIGRSEGGDAGADGGVRTEEETEMSEGDGPGESAIGHEVVAANGEVLGKVREAHPHFLQVRRDVDPPVDLNVPMRAVSAVESGRIVLKVNLEALTELPEEDQTVEGRGEEAE